MTTAAWVAVDVDGEFAQVGALLEQIDPAAWSGTAAQLARRALGEVQQALGAAAGLAQTCQQAQRAAAAESWARIGAAWTGIGG